MGDSCRCTSRNREKRAFDYRIANVDWIPRNKEGEEVRIQESIDYEEVLITIEYSMAKDWTRANFQALTGVPEIVEPLCKAGKCRTLQ